MSKLEIIVMSHLVNEVIKFPDRTLVGVLGSPTAYSSVALGKMGAKVGVVSKIGTDVGEDFLQPLREAKVDIRGISTGGSDTTHSVLVYDKNGEKKIFYPKKAKKIMLSDIPTEYFDTKIFYICPMDFEVSIGILKNLRNRGINLASDIGGYGGAHSSSHPDKEEQKDNIYIKELISYLDIVKASKEDCMHLFGFVNKKPDEIVKFLVSLGANIATLTLGEEGAIVATRDKILKAPAFKVKVKDVSGAGDMYMAGFLFEYLKTNDIYKSLLFGEAAASILIEQTGGVTAKRMPTQFEVYKRISNLDIIKE